MFERKRRRKKQSQLWHFGILKTQSVICLISDLFYFFRHFLGKNCVCVCWSRPWIAGGLCVWCISEDVSVKFMKRKTQKYDEDPCHMTCNYTRKIWISSITGSMAETSKGSIDAHKHTFWCQWMPVCIPLGNCIHFARSLFIFYFTCFLNNRYGIEEGNNHLSSQYYSLNWWENESNRFSFSLPAFN